MMVTEHFARPQIYGPDGRRVNRGRSTCRVCGEPVVRVGRRIATDGVAGSWKHETPQVELASPGERD